MLSAFSNDVFRDPMVQPRTLAMLRLCRKIIYQEFGVKLAFNQPDLLEEIARYATRSRNLNLRELSSRLRIELR